MVYVQQQVQVGGSLVHRLAACRITGAVVGDSTTADSSQNTCFNAESTAAAGLLGSQMMLFTVHDSAVLLCLVANCMCDLQFACTGTAYIGRSLLVFSTSCSCSHRQSVRCL